MPRDERYQRSSKRDRHRSKRSRHSRSRSRSVSRERSHGRHRSRHRVSDERDSYGRHGRSRGRDRSKGRSRSRSPSLDRKRKSSHTRDRHDGSRRSSGKHSRKRSRSYEKSPHSHHSGAEKNEDIKRKDDERDHTESLAVNGVPKSLEIREPPPTAAHPAPQETTNEHGKDIGGKDEPEQAAPKENETTPASNLKSGPEETVQKNSSTDDKLGNVPARGALVDRPDSEPATEPKVKSVESATEPRVAPSKFHVAVATPMHAREPPKQKKSGKIRVGGFFAANDGDESDSSLPLPKRPLPTLDTKDVSDPPLSGELASGAKDGDDEEDPLDAFMTGIENEVATTTAQNKNEDAGRMLSDDEDAGGVRKAVSDEEEDFVVEEEEEEESWLTKLRKKRPVYEKINHADMDYAQFKKNFYIETSELSRMTAQEVAMYRRELGGVRIRGKNCPRPVKTWGQCGLPSKILEAIRKLNYAKPTPIQAQAIPCIMSGRDVIGVAKTGSGKTLSFLLPMMRHIAAQPAVTMGEGPIGVIIAPTRELAIQIYGEAKKFCKAMNLRSVCAYGGSGVGEQISDLKRGAEVVVCTPGRMIDLLAMNQGRITNLKRVSFVVLDEADRMFDMGFEPQITRIVENVRPDRQTVMFSATFPSQVEMLARKILKSPVEIVVGGNSVASATIDQHVEVMEPDQKFTRLLDVISEWQSKGSILVFVERQESADRIFRDLARAGHQCLALHGGMDQDDRDSAIVDFRNGVVKLLIATSVAARGLDVKQLRVVVNYDVPNHYEDYVHRVGRTGRAGNQGTAYTFITPEQDMHAVELVKALELSAKKATEDANPDKEKKDLNLDEVAKAAVPDDLRKLAAGFTKKMKDGLVKHGASSGYGGKGFKFDEAEENANAALKKLQGEEYGVEVKIENAKADDEDEPIIKDIARDGHGEKREEREKPTPSTTADAKPAPPSGTTKAADSSANDGPGITDAALQGKLKAQEIAERLSRMARNRPTKQSGNAPSKPGSNTEQSAAAAAAAKINMRLGGNTGGGAPPPVEEEPDTAVMRKYTELEINDYPQHARWMVTKKNSLNDIEDFTSCAVTTKGLHYPPGRNPAPGERKLYLLIEGPDESSVKTARADIKRRLDEAALARPDEKPAYGKYSIV